MTSTVLIATNLEIDLLSYPAKKLDHLLFTCNLIDHSISLNIKEHQ